MPIYEYVCGKCGKDQTAYRSIDERHNGPDCCGQRAEKVISRHMVNADIQPYRAVAADKRTGKCPVINSRKEHRDFLRRNGYEEIGSEPTENLMKHSIRKTHASVDLGFGDAPTVDNINLAPQE